MSAPRVLVAPVPAGIDDVRTMLRDLAEAGAVARAADDTSRTWVIIGEVAVGAGLSENDGVVEHDRLGRQAVRLAVDKTLCVGGSRSVRALHQGAIMEGSWGDEARLVASTAEARELLSEPGDWCPESADVVFVAAASPEIAALAELWRDG